MDWMVLSACTVIVVVSGVLAELRNEDEETNFRLDFNLNFGWWCGEDDYQEGCEGPKRFPVTWEDRSHQNNTTFHSSRIDGFRITAVSPNQVPTGFTSEPLNSSYLVMDLCLNDICLYYCEKNGFSKGWCHNFTICLCTATNIGLPKTSTTQPASDLYVVMNVLCLNMTCSYYCEQKGLSKSSCTDSKTCHCQSTGIEQPATANSQKNLHILMDLCLNRICSYYCKRNGFSEGTCSDFKSCICTSGRYSEQTTIDSKKGLNVLMDICLNKICAYYCKRKGITGDCISTTKCECSKSHFTTNTPRKHHR